MMIGDAKYKMTIEVEANTLSDISDALEQALSTAKRVANAYPVMQFEGANEPHFRYRAGMKVDMRFK